MLHPVEKGISSFPFQEKQRRRKNSFDIYINEFSVFDKTFPFHKYKYPTHETSHTHTWIRNKEKKKNNEMTVNGIDST